MSLWQIKRASPSQLLSRPFISVRSCHSPCHPALEAGLTPLALTSLLLISEKRYEFGPPCPPLFMLIATSGQVSTASRRDFKNSWILQPEPKFSPLQSNLPVLCPSPIHGGYYKNSSSLAFLDCQESSLCLTVCLSVCQTAAFPCAPQSLASSRSRLLIELCAGSYADAIKHIVTPHLVCVSLSLCPLLWQDPFLQEVLQDDSSPE